MSDVLELLSKVELLLKHQPGRHDQQKHAGDRGMGGVSFEPGDDASLRGAVQAAGWSIDEARSSGPGKQVHTSWSSVDAEGGKKAVRLVFINLPGSAHQTMQVADVTTSNKVDVSSMKGSVTRNVSSVTTKKDAKSWVREGVWDKPPETHSWEGPDAGAMRALYGE